MMKSKLTPLFIALTTSITASQVWANCPTTELTAIHTVQGSQAESPLVGKQVRIQGVVTAQFADPSLLGGFYLHSLQPDDNPNTSEGIFVYDSTKDARALKVGEIVTVMGTVDEYHQQTQLKEVDKIETCSANDVDIPVRTLTLPVSSLEHFEALEGMPVRFEQPLVINGHYQLARYGQFDVSHERLYTPTQIMDGGDQAQQQIYDYQLQRLIIDDNQQGQNPARVPFPDPFLSAKNSLRSGNAVTNAEGILAQFDRSYRLQPTVTLSIDERNPRPEAPAAPTANDVRIASFNVLNYFNGDGQGQGFPTPRGAENLAELQRQQAKILAALTGIKADVIGVMEIENDGYHERSAIAQLAKALSLATDQPWKFATPNSTLLGSDQITNGILYRADRVKTMGESAVLTAKPFDRGSRPPFAQTFTTDKGGQFTLVVNHFKSKGSCPTERNNPNANQNDGQACWNALRADSASALTSWLAKHPTNIEHNAYIVLGDFNAYAQEDPMQAFEQAGYLNLLETFEPNGYSYVYDAQAGSLDHILVHPSLKEAVSQQRHWAINADEPMALQYNLSHKSETQQEIWYNADPYRSSDHDPLYLDLRLNQ